MVQPSNCVQLTSCCYFLATFKNSPVPIRTTKLVPPPSAPIEGKLIDHEESNIHRVARYARFAFIQNHDCLFFFLFRPIALIEELKSN